MDETGVRRQSRRTIGNVALANPTHPQRPRRSVGEDYPPGTRAVVKKENGQSMPLFVDFVKVEMASLMRYQAYYNLDAPPNATKRELMAVVMRHFVEHPRLRDAEVISAFLYANQKYRRSLGQIQQ